MEIYFVKLQTVSEGRGFESRRCHCNLHIPSDRTMPLGSTEPKEMSSKNISSVVKAAGA